MIKRLFFLNLFLACFLEGISQSDFLLPVVNDSGKWGYIDTQGALIIRHQYDQAYAFTEGRGLVAITLNGNFVYSFVDAKGTIFGNWMYVQAEPFQNGYARVEFYIDILNTAWGYLDKNGNISPPLAISDSRSFSEGYAAVKKLGGWGFINKRFKDAIKAQYDATGMFSEGLCAVALGTDSLQRWGYINALGQQITPMKYLQAGKFSNHLARVQILTETTQLRKTIRKKTFGFIGGNGDFLIPARYEDASDFSEGLARVTVDKHIRFIDVMGNTVFDLDSGLTASDFHSGFCVVHAPGRAYFIDKTGTIAYDYNFTELTDFRNGYSFFTKRNGVSGYLDSNGNIIWKNK